MSSLDSPWLMLVKERFSPLSSVPLILCFVISNGLLAAHLTDTDPYWGMYVPAFCLALSSFLRLRLFDEIKDYALDLHLHPTRPLARGILTVKQVWRGALILITFELVLAACISPEALLAQLLSIIYSLLMYQEFFIGSWLRPRLTTYAVSHTFVSALIGYSMTVVLVSKSLWELPSSFLGVGLMYWSLFNLFEFSRKTFAPGEEKLGVDTYSSLFGIPGAVALSLSQALIAYAIGAYFVGFNILSLSILGVLCLVSTGFLLKPSVSLAKLFRNLSGAVMLFFFIGMIWNLGLFWSKQ